MAAPRHLLLVTFLTAALLVGATATQAKETPPPTPKLWNGRDQARHVWAMAKEYFDADKARRVEIESALDALGAIQPKHVKKHAKKLLKYASKAGPTLPKKSGSTFTHGKLTGRVFWTGAKKRKPLLIALHGGGKGVGDGRNALQKWSLASGRCTVLAPTAPDLRDSAWNHADIEQWVLALIEAAKRTWGCDTNRIYVAGHSMGGFGTWAIGARHADRFAALAPCAGGLHVRVSGGQIVGVAGGLIPNLLNTPIRFFHSTDDRQVSHKSSQAADRLLKELKAKGYAYEWIYDEYTDIGHGLPKKGLGPIVDWLLERKRDPHPKHVVWEPSVPHKRRFAWLEKEGNAHIEGRIEGNTITLSGAGAGGRVTLYLCKELVDLESNVTIRVEDKTVFEGPVATRLSVLLRTIATTRDPHQYYAAAVTVP